MTAALQRIHKLRVLPVSQIKPLLILQFDIPIRRPQRRLLLVLPPTVPRNEVHINQTQTPTNNNRHLSGDIPRRVLWPESLRPNDITNTIPDEVKRGNCRLLRVTRDITTDERQQTDEARRRCLRQVVPDEPADGVVQRQADDQKHAEDADP